MHDDWEVYFCHVQENPATILLNLALHERAPMEGYPIMAYLDVTLLNPDESGLTAEEEFPRLLELEDAILGAVENEVIYVGRCATDGLWTFFFYLPENPSWGDRVHSVMLNFPEYSWDSGMHEDPGWETYLDFLYPDKADMDGIRNERVRRQLAENGDDLEEPRPVEHWLTFSTMEDRAGFSLEAAKQGFTILADTPEEDPAAAPPDQETGQEASFGLALQRPDAPADLDEVTLGLHEMAEPFRGSYLGWSTSLAVEKEE